MSKLKIKLNRETCINNQNCIKIDPKNFEIKMEKALLKSGKTDEMSSLLEVEVPEDEAKKIINAAKSCPVNAISVENIETNQEIVSTQVNEDKTREVKAVYNDSEEFALDPAGYFLIRINKEKNEIEVGFCNERNKLILKVTGKKPIDIYHIIINNEKVPIRKDHCAYIGRELQKAYIALKNNLDYVQDDELILK